MSDGDIGQWIACADRLPADGQGVLITNGKDVVSADFFSGNPPVWNYGDVVEMMLYDMRVTHWMALPEPPKE